MKEYKSKPNLIDKLLVLITITCLLFSCNNATDKNYYELYKKRASEVKRDTLYKYINTDISLMNSDSFLISKRSYLTDSSFVDYNILGTSDTDAYCSINFKVRDKIWYVFDGADWQIFYADSKLHNVDLLYSNRVIIPENRYLLNGEELLSFKWKGKDVIYESGVARCFFSPKHGVVIIGGRDYVRRDDYSPKGLDSLMKSM